MPDIDEIYENAGELTKACLDEIIEDDYSFFDDEDEITEEYLLTYKFKTFFFLKLYYECPFNYRIIDEAVYYFCLNSDKSYNYAQSLKEKAEIIFNNSEKHEAEYEFTSAVGTGLRNIHSEEEFLNFILSNSSEFHVDNRTAYKYASQLIEDCCELAKSECENRDEIRQRNFPQRSWY